MVQTLRFEHLRPQAYAILGCDAALRRPGMALAREVLETLAREVVSALADEVSFQSVDGRPAVRFTKRPTQQAPTNADDQG